MASIKNSLTGAVSGKIGPVVVFVRNGKQVVRINPKQNDPKTPKQLAHREKFKLANKGMSPLNTAIKMGYKNSDKTYRKLVGMAYHEAIVGEYPDYSLDYGKIKIAEGNMLLPNDVKIDIEDYSNTVRFSWNPNIPADAKLARDNDMVNIVCLSGESKFALNRFSIAIRSEGKASLKLPDGWIPTETRYWLFLSSYDLGENSDSMYIDVETNKQA